MREDLRVKRQLSYARLTTQEGTWNEKALPGTLSSADRCQSQPIKKAQWRMNLLGESPVEELGGKWWPPSWTKYKFPLRNCDGWSVVWQDICYRQQWARRGRTLPCLCLAVTQDEGRVHHRVPLCDTDAAPKREARKACRPDLDLSPGKGCLYFRVIFQLNTTGKVKLTEMEITTDRRIKEQMAFWSWLV